jgi:ankyrin repeat protein
MQKWFNRFFRKPKIEVVRDLYEKIEAKDLEGVREILTDNNIDINSISAEDISSYSPLIYAVKHGNSEIVKLLLEKGAQVDKYSPCPTRGKVNALLFATEHCDGKTWADCDNEPGYIEANKLDFTKKIAYLLRYGANPNSQASMNRHNPLIYSAQSKNLKAVYILLKYGADPLMKTYGGNTALDYLYRDEVSDIINLLLIESLACLHYDSLPSNIKILIPTKEQLTASIMIPYKTNNGTQYITTISDLKKISSLEGTSIDLNDLLKNVRVMLELLITGARDINSNFINKQEWIETLRLVEENIIINLVKSTDKTSLKWQCLKYFAHKGLTEDETKLLPYDLKESIEQVKALIDSNRMEAKEELWAIVKKGDLKKFRDLIGTDVIKDVNEYWQGTTLLHSLVTGDKTYLGPIDNTEIANPSHKEIAEELLQRGANLHAPIKKSKKGNWVASIGRTPLQMAAVYNNDSIFSINSIFNANASYAYTAEHVWPVFQKHLREEKNKHLSL